ncbi:MAG: hypothetical protein HDS02_00055 [Bacteroides sp.]|nr:hypothetical protein [Bacteroides sp.]
MHIEIEEIFHTDNLDRIAVIARSAGHIDRLREQLYAEFMKVACYSTPQQWNRAVRLCETLAIIGWGSHEAVEAHAQQYVNGYPNTFFITPTDEVRFLDAVWKPHDGGMIIDPRLSSLTAMPARTISPVACEKVKLHSQRNWLPKPPVQIVRTLDNCYPSSRAVLQSITTELNPMLLERMRPEEYGNQINRILINCAMSFSDGPHCKTNYIIADESRKLRKSDYYAALLATRDIAEIEREGLYMRPRFDIGPFRKDTGMIYATICFEKEFSHLTVSEQKHTMAGYFMEVVRRISIRQRKLTYNFTPLLTDLLTLLTAWAPPPL